MVPIMYEWGKVKKVPGNKIAITIYSWTVWPWCNIDFKRIFERMQNSFHIIMHPNKPKISRYRSPCSCWHIMHFPSLGIQKRDEILFDELLLFSCLHSKIIYIITRECKLKAYFVKTKVHQNSPLEIRPPCCGNIAFD